MGSFFVGKMWRKDGQNMKKIVKLVAGVLLCIGVVMLVKSTVYADDFVIYEIRTLQNGTLSSRNMKLHNDTTDTVWVVFGGHFVWQQNIYIYKDSTHGGIKLTPGASTGTYDISGGGPKFNVIQNDAFCYKVTLKFGNGEPDDEKYVSPGEQLASPAKPVYQGYVFKGWYEDEDYTTKFDFNTTIEQDYTLYAKWVEASSGEVVPFKEYSSYIDRDTYKSEMPSRTILVSDNSNDTGYMDMKIHATGETNIINQKFLAGQLVGKNANELITKDVYPRRDLSITENGDRRELIWNNLDIKTAGVVSAVVYNQTDGAYVIYGISDGKGCVKFNDFILRPASTITVLKNN